MQLNLKIFMNLINSLVTTNQKFIYRYIAVNFPLRSRWIFTLKRTRIGIVIVCIFAIIYNVTRFLEYETIVEYIPTSTNTTNSGTFKVICSNIKICNFSELFSKMCMLRQLLKASIEFTEWEQCY